MTVRTSFAATASLAALAFSTPAAGKDCGALARISLENGKVSSAELVEAGKFQPPAGPFGSPPGVGAGVYANLPAFCRVQATLTPTSSSDIKVEVWLPADGWNGKFVGIGNGVWAGQLSISQLGDPLSRGYAVATTNAGHTGNGMSAGFAAGHFEKLVDFGHRAVHLMTNTAKQAIREYYGEGPSLSLWNSCSTGGRQGVMAAARYPEDYDAISAMAPANPMTDLMTQSMWVSWVNKRRPGAQLTQPKMAAVHRAVITQCDSLDGLDDGIVGRPDACSFDPASLLCQAGDASDCLTAPQVEALEGIYEGVTSPDGTILLPGWPRGGEMQIATLIMGPEPFPVAMSYFQQLVHESESGWDWTTMDYAAELAAARRYGAAVLDVPYDGLGAFFDRGGKLLLSHGWTDGLIPASNAVAFYNGLLADLPADQADQVRLFMIPGMDHCGGGEGAHSFDTLGAIDAWATTGKALDRIVATRANPRASNSPSLSRPLCPYPRYARYDGEGDPALAENFSCVMPEN